MYEHIQQYMGVAPQPSLQHSSWQIRYDRFVASKIGGHCHVFHVLKEIIHPELLLLYGQSTSDAILNNVIITAKNQNKHIDGFMIPMNRNEKLHPQLSNWMSDECINSHDVNPWANHFRTDLKDQAAEKYKGHLQDDYDAIVKNTVNILAACYMAKVNFIMQ